jgi:sodium transport system permease protein
MSNLLVVVRKELRDMFRDRRTMLTTLLIGPLMFPLLIIGMGTMAEKRARTQLEGTLKLPVIGAEHAPNLVRFLEGQNIMAEPAPRDPDADVRAQTYDTILRIAPDFAERWRESRSAQVELIYDSSRRDSRIPVGRVRGAIEEYSRTLGTLRIIERGISPEVMQPVRVAQRDVATPESKRGTLLEMFLPYFLILSAFLGGAAVVIDATAGERERQSLEPLLATPADRAAIMSGKILASIILGMISLALILAAFKASLIAAPGPLRQVELSGIVLVQLLGVLLPMVLVGTTLLTLIAASAKSTKEAQSYMPLMILLPVVPTLILMVNPIKKELWQFAVPFLSQNQLILRLVRDELITSAEWVVYLSSSFGLGLILWIMASRLYHKEKLAISA